MGTAVGMSLASSNALNDADVSFLCSYQCRSCQIFLLTVLSNVVFDNCDEIWSFDKIVSYISYYDIIHDNNNNNNGNDDGSDNCISDGNTNNNNNINSDGNEKEQI